MKKILSILLIFALASSLFACSKTPAETEPAITVPDRDFIVIMRAYVEHKDFGYYTEITTRSHEYVDIREGDRITWKQMGIFREEDNSNPMVEIVSIDDDSVTIKTKQGTEVVKYNQDQTVYEFKDKKEGDLGYVTFTTEAAPVICDRDYKVTMEVYAHYSTSGVPFRFEDIQEGDKFAWLYSEILRESGSDDPMIRIISIDDEGVTCKCKWGSSAKLVEGKYNEKQIIYETKDAGWVSLIYVVFTKES